MAGSKKTVKKRKVSIESNGFAYVKSTFNNIIVSITNNQGQVISWSSAGKMGFRGSKKNTPYAAQVAAQDCAKVAVDLGLKKSRSTCKRTWCWKRIGYTYIKSSWFGGFRN